MSSQRLRPIAWQEGMFLRPQHLQQQDLYVDDRLSALVRSLDPFHWGVRRFEINEEALSDHRVELLSLDAVLPGGTLLRYPGNAVVETREFNPDAESVDVHIGMRRLKPSEANSAPEDGSREARFKVTTETVADLNRGGFETPIDVLQANVRMFLSGEELELETCDSFKLARIEATGGASRPFALARTYAPPLLALQGHPALVEEVLKIVSQIAAKVRVVSGRTTTVSTADLPNMWMRYTLARMTPVLRHLLMTGSTSPYQLYTALVEAAGAIASFALQEPAELPLYQHDDLYGCYSELLQFIDSYLGGAVQEKFTELALEFQTVSGNKIYATKSLTIELVDPRNSFFLGIKAALDSKELVQLMRESGKSASISELGSLLMMNLDGLRIEHLPGAPTEIAAKTGYEYFKVEPHGKQWNRIKDEFSFALSLPKLESAKVSLYVVSHEV